MSVHEFIRDRRTVSSQNVHYIHKHVSYAKPLYIILSGAIDKFICVSWFYKSGLNCLWIKDSIPYTSYSSDELRTFIERISLTYRGVVFFGMSMGGVGSLLNGINVPNTLAIIGVDCEPRGMSYDCFHNMFKLTGNQYFKVHLISCANTIEINFHKKICDSLQNFTQETCERKDHLANVPSKQYIYKLFNMYGSIDYSKYYVNAWDKVNKTDYKWT